MSEPLAERMRPHTLADYVGQQHLVGEGAVLRKMIDAGRISSFILWGPWSGQDYPCSNRGTNHQGAVLHPLCGDQWRKGCPRGDRKSKEW